MARRCAFRLALILVALLEGAECHQIPVVSVGDLGTNCSASGSCVSSDTVDLFQVDSKAVKMVALPSGAQAIAPSLALVQKNLHRLKAHMVDKAAALNDFKNNVGKLVADIVTEKTSSSDVTSTALDAIRDSVNDVFSDITVTHAVDQELVDQAEQVIQNCDDLNVDLSEYELAASTSALEHIACRTEEATMKHTMDGKKTVFDATIDTEPAECGPDSVDEWTDAAIAQRTKSVNDMSEWVILMKDHKAEWDTAADAHSSQILLCNANQSEYEKTFCTLHDKLTTKCEDYANCRTDTIATRNNTHAAVNESQASRIAEFKAGMHILCFLNVLNLTSHVEQVEELDNCGNFSVEDDLLSNITIVFHDIPVAQSCDISIVQTKPCDAEWVDHYEDQTWFPDAPAAQCDECFHLTPTPAPEQ